MMALRRLGYQVTGVDFSEAQIELARKALGEGEEYDLICADICSGLEDIERKFDLVLSVGAAHFCEDLDCFVAGCAKVCKVGGTVIVSFPHPVDMLVQFDESTGEVSFTNYFPEDRRVEAAHYWQKFAGKLAMSDSLCEYVCRPSDVVNSMVAHGFNVRQIVEPLVDNVNAPCRFVGAGQWFTDEFCRRVPQYLIVKAVFSGQQS